MNVRSLSGSVLTPARHGWRVWWRVGIPTAHAFADAFRGARHILTKRLDPAASVPRVTTRYTTELQRRTQHARHAQHEHDARTKVRCTGIPATKGRCRSERRINVRTRLYAEYARYPTAMCPNCPAAPRRHSSLLQPTPEPRTALHASAQAASRQRPGSVQDTHPAL